MCGFAGILTTEQLRTESLEDRVREMTAPIRHRGPDDSGSWVDAAAGVGLGFRRLSIIDLSPLGHQPMRSASGRFTLVFNGEVYNHHELRAELLARGARFRGHSDTEVILAAFEEWGIEASVRRFVGMFAMAVWDAHARALTLLRDRMGIKPLFVHARAGTVTFASELKALCADPGFDRSPDPDALAAYLRWLYVPAPGTIYPHTVKLRPGHLLTVRDPARPLPASTAYWSAEEVARRGLADPLDLGDEEAADRLEAALADAVRMRMYADVPLGALLSGGIDSSTVVALMQAVSSRPVKTFSIGFDQPDFDEAPHAARVAAHLGTDHTALMVTGEDALRLVPRLPDLFDEPFADSSQVPTYLVCELARREVTVALSGDGGDELFAGYNRYTVGERLLEGLRRVPSPARRLVAAGIGSLSPDGWDRLAGAVAPILPGRAMARFRGDRLHKIGRFVTMGSVPAMYRFLVSACQDPGRLVRGGRERAEDVTRILGGAEPASLLDRMLLADQVTYLADDLLAKVDRASMAVSLEVRVPILDHRVVELAWRLDRRMKVRGGEGKWLLKQVLYRHVPRPLVDRAKMGFSVPVQAWLRGPLREWADDLLAPDALARDGLLDPAAVRDAWRRFHLGEGTLAPTLWALVMFQAWRERWLGAASSRTLAA